MLGKKLDVGLPEVGSTVDLQLDCGLPTLLYRSRNTSKNQERIKRYKGVSCVDKPARSCDIAKVMGRNKKRVTLLDSEYVPQGSSHVSLALGICPGR